MFAPWSSEAPECKLEFEADSFDVSFDLGDPYFSSNLGLCLCMVPFSRQ